MEGVLLCDVRCCVDLVGCARRLLGSPLGTAIWMSGFERLAYMIMLRCCGLSDGSTTEALGLASRDTIGCLWQVGVSLASRPEG